MKFIAQVRMIVTRQVEFEASEHLDRTEVFDQAIEAAKKEWGGDWDEYEIEDCTFSLTSGAIGSLR